MTREEIREFADASGSDGRLIEALDAVCHGDPVAVRRAWEDGPDGGTCPPASQIMSYLDSVYEGWRTEDGLWWGLERWPAQEGR